MAIEYDMTTETSSIADKKSPFKALLTRFLCVYLLLFAFPFPLNAALSIPLILVAQLLAPFGIEMPMLLEVSNVLDHVTDTVVSLFTVPLGKIFGLTVILGPTGSGDTAHRFVRVALLATLSLLIALVWNWRKQGEFPSRKARWAHVLGRWWLAAIMIKYGVIKVFCQQFGAGENAHELVSAVGDYSPMHLAWVFMSHSPGYQRFAGFAELIPAILILHRRTALPGLLMMFGVLSNVFAMNLCFDIPVKLHSGHYLVATLVLLAPYWPRLRAFIRGENQVPTPNLYIKPKRFSENTWAKITLAMGTALVVASVAGTRLRSMQFESMQTPSPYAGRWDVQQTQRDGVPWHDAGIKGFKTLAIDNLGRFSRSPSRGKKTPWASNEILPIKP